MHALPGNWHYREDALTIHGSQPLVGIISELDVTDNTSLGIDYYVISSEQNKSEWQGGKLNNENTSTQQDSAWICNSVGVKLSRMKSAILQRERTGGQDIKPLWEKYVYLPI